MRFAATKNSIRSALDRVSRIVKSNPKSLEILQCVKIYTYAGRVYVEASSPRASTRVVVDGAKVVDSGSFLVDFDKFKDRISKTTGAAVLDATSGTSLVITSTEDQRLSIRLRPVEEFPVVDWDIPDESYAVEVDALVSMIKDASRTLRGVTALTPAFLQVKVSNKEAQYASGMSYYKLPLDCHESLDVSIPSDMLSAIDAFVSHSKEDRVWVSQSGSNMVVTVNDDQIQASSLNIAFPDMASAIEKIRVSSVQDLEVDRKRLISEISDSRSSSDEHGAVTMTINGTLITTLTIRTESELGDTFESTMPCQWSGEAGREMTFTCSSLLNFLNTFSKDTITLNTGDPARGTFPPLYYEEGDRVGVLNQFH